MRRRMITSAHSGLVPTKAGLRPATVRHLLTHTAGVGYWRRLSDLLQPGVGSGDRAARSGALPLAEYYRRGLPVEVEPGTKWVYSNHGFAALGQIVEDVSGQPLDRYLRDRIFDPLGMEHTDLLRSERVRPTWQPGMCCAPAASRRSPTARSRPRAGAGCIPPRRTSLATSPPCWDGWQRAGLGAAAGDPGDYVPTRTSSRIDVCRAWVWRSSSARRGVSKTVGKTGILSGFHSAMAMAPEEGSGSSFSATPAASTVAARPCRWQPCSFVSCLAFPLTQSASISRRAQRPGAKSVDGTAPAPGPVTNLSLRVLMGAGAEVVVQGGHLMLKPLTPIPAMRRGFRLYPDDPDDPWVFRIYFPEFGMDFRVVFDGGPKDGMATRLLLDVMSFERRPDLRNPRPWMTGGAGRRHGGAGHPRRPAPSRFLGHLIGRSSSRALAADPGGRSPILDRRCTSRCRRSAGPGRTGYSRSG